MWSYPLADVADKFAKDLIGGLDQAKQRTALRRVFVKGKIEVTVYIAKALESIRTSRKRGMVSLQVKYLFQTLNTYQSHKALDTTM